jgi:HEAT repeat protein
MDALGRLPEIVRAMSSFRSKFLTDVVPKLTRILVNEEANQLVHFQVVNSLTGVAKALAVFEEFETIEIIGKTMDQVATSNVTRHAGCCVRALDGLLSKNAVERIIELTLTKKDDPRWTRLAVSLIRWAGQSAIEKVFQGLEEEQVATNRIALIRFISKIGPTALDVARTRIRHERWYVVRNTCKLLAELKDPELLTHIAPALRHPDQRVQLAATKAVSESRIADRGPVLADALPHVHPAVRDELLDDLRFLKDPKTVNALERFIFSENNGGLATATKAVLTLSAIPGEQSESVLNQIMIDRSRDLALRRSAYGALCQRKTITAARRLMEFSRSGDDDPLAATVRQNLAWSGARE